MALQQKYKTVGGIVRPIDFQETQYLRTPEGTAGGREAVEPVLPGIPPQIGDVVLFSIGPNTFRPLLVVSLREMGKVCGTLFVDPELDSSSPWVHRNAFAKPQKTSPYIYVDGVKYGEGLGEWRTKPVTMFIPKPYESNGGGNVGSYSPDPYDRGGAAVLSLDPRATE